MIYICVCWEIVLFKLVSVCFVVGFFPFNDAASVAQQVYFDPFLYLTSIYFKHV